MVGPGGAPCAQEPVFGQGPEVHVAPAFGYGHLLVGRRVQVVGLGFRPGAHVQLVALARGGTGTTVEEIARGFVAKATVGPAGRVEASFTFRPQMYYPNNGGFMVYEVFASYDHDPETILAHRAGASAYLVVQ